MRIFQKPKPNGKMEVSEDIFRNPKELEALKVKVKPEEYLKTLYDKIFSKEQELEKLELDSKSKKEALERDHAENTARKGKEIESLEDVLGIKRAEYAELSKPFIDKTKELNEREALLSKVESSLVDGQQKVFERERDVENRLIDIKYKVDELGDWKVSLQRQKDTIEGRESSIKEKEMQYLAKVELFSKETRNTLTLLEKEKEDVKLRELNVESKIENIEQREAQLMKDRTLLEDRRKLHQRNVEEFKRIKN